jgi:NTP pyrophosphatase (non-canonical NTP hydrolase)
MLSIFKKWFHTDDKTLPYWNVSKDNDGMSLFICTNYIRVKYLLDEKGFSYSKEDRYEKIALLHTEVSELIDAFKKGKGDDEEGAELADIAIRLLNIPCIYPEIIDNLGLEPDCGRQTIIFRELNEDSPIKNIKFTIGCAMHEAICDLNYTLSDLEDNCSEANYIETIDEMYTILLLLELYSENILHKNLQELVDKKMEKNWERPYRYNTNPELFK